MNRMNTTRTWPDLADLATSAAEREQLGDPKLSRLLSFSVTVLTEDGMGEQGAARA